MSFFDEPNIHKVSVIKSCQVLISLRDFQSIHIVDFGGGCGLLVHPLLSFFANHNIDLKISIIDSKSNIEFGKHTFSKEKNVHFYEQDKLNVANLFDLNKSNKFATILNLSSVIQYIPQYKEFLKSILKQKKPTIVCINRFPRCENTDLDAFAIQNVETPLGFCGSTVVNLFGKTSLVKVMNDLGYSVLFEDCEADSIDWFDRCSYEQYRKMSMVAYAFVKNNNLS